MDLNGFTFRLEHQKSDAWDSGEHFNFFKTKALVDQYATFFEGRKGRKIEHVFELGIFDGGSTAFWVELLKPEKHVAIDFQFRKDSDYFKAWKASRSLGRKVETYWQTDQADKAELRRLATRDLAGVIDLVIDDASHLYAQSKASFETLFPMCRPGGVYIIEDWAWDHWLGFSDPGHPWAQEQRLTQLIIEILEAAGTTPELISKVEVFNGFVAVERGPLVLGAGEFRLEDHIRRREAREYRFETFTPPSPLSRLKRYVRRLLA